MNLKQALSYILLACSLLVLVASCAKGRRSSGMEDDIAEAVFRYEFGLHVVTHGTNTGARYLELRGADPDDAFMERFEGLQPPVKKRSQCSTKEKRVVDTKTGMPGWILFVDRIGITGQDTAEAVGGYYRNGVSARKKTYFLKRKNKRWVVTRCVAVIIS